MRTQGEDDAKDLEHPFPLVDLSSFKSVLFIRGLLYVQKSSSHERVYVP